MNPPRHSDEEEYPDDHGRHRSGRDTEQDGLDPAHRPAPGGLIEARVSHSR